MVSIVCSNSSRFNLPKETEPFLSQLEYRNGTVVVATKFILQVKTGTATVCMYICLPASECPQWNITMWRSLISYAIGKVQQHESCNAEEIISL